MIYALITYLLFLALYQQWGDASVTWQVIYFMAQYSFAGAVSLIQFTKTKSLVYCAIALIFAVMTVNEFSYLGSTPEDYSKLWSSTPVYFFTVLIIIFFVAYEIITKWKKVSN